MRILYLLIAFSFLAGPVGEARAENPTPEKCTCNLNPDDPPEDGAWVKNASACWSTEVREQNWCDVVVESLQGPQSTSAELLGNADSPPGLVNILRSRFDNFIRVSEVEGSIVDLNQATEIVASRLKENDVLVANCVTAFVGGKRGFVQDGDGGVVCRVSESSGWLRLEIPVDGARIAYMVAPVP